MTVQLQTIFARETRKHKNVNLLYILAIIDYSWHSMILKPTPFYTTILAIIEYYQLVLCA